MSKNRAVIPTNFSVPNPRLIDPAKTAAQALGYATVGSMKLLLKGAGAAVEFGTAIIVQNNGRGQKTKSK